MNSDAIRELMLQDLEAMKAGGGMAAGATREIRNVVRHPDLAASLDEGHSLTGQWAQRIDQALREVGRSGQRRNPIIEAHYEAGRSAREHAPDDLSRDLGIIANGQLSLHYWIAAFGTVRDYAERLGMTDVASAMQSSLNDAKRISEMNSRNAKTLMSA